MRVTMARCLLVPRAVTFVDYRNGKERCYRNAPHPIAVPGIGRVRLSAPLPELDSARSHNCESPFWVGMRTASPRMSGAPPGVPTPLDTLAIAAELPRPTEGSFPPRSPTPLSKHGPVGMKRASAALRSRSMASPTTRANRKPAGQGWWRMPTAPASSRRPTALMIT
jgi:hypothetical protein